MTPELGNIWAIGLIAFCFKSGADFYMGYFKWLQASDARSRVSLSNSIEQNVLAKIEPMRALLIVAALGLLIALFSQFLREEYRFPFLTLVSLLISTAISLLGSLGDLRRAATLQRRT